MSRNVAALDVAILRGGTTRGVFTTMGDIDAFANRDDVVRRILGSPDPVQVDGLGGTHAVNSKFVVVGRSRLPGVDLDYQVAQVGVGNLDVDWSGTCGNLTAAAGPYGLLAGLVDIEKSAHSACLVLHNLSTGGRIESQFRVRDGQFDAQGDARIAGVQGTGSEIVNRYRDPVGGTLGTLYPTRQPEDSFSFEGTTVRGTVADITHPYLMVDGRDWGVDGQAPFAELVRDAGLQGRLEAFRCSVADGLRVADQQRSGVPRLILCYPDSECDLRVLAFSGGRFIPAIPVTAGLALAAAARLPGTLPARLARIGNADRARIAHPSGVIELTVDVEGERVRSASLVRTARLIMQGRCYL